MRAQTEDFFQPVHEQPTNLDQQINSQRTVLQGSQFRQEEYQDIDDHGSSDDIVAKEDKTKINLLVLIVGLLIAVNGVLWAKYSASTRIQNQLQAEITSIKRQQKIKLNQNLEKKFVSSVPIKYQRYSRYQKSTNPLIDCQPRYFNQLHSNPSYLTANDYNLQQLPYPSLFMVQDSEAPSLNQHYSDLVTALKLTPLQHSVYIHSAPVYVVLLIGAASKDISITIAYNYPQKYQLLTAFILNNMRHKLFFEQQIDVRVNRQRAESLVTTSVQFAQIYMQQKAILLIAEGPVTIPKTSGLFKLEHTGWCTMLPPTSVDRESTEPGIYFSLKKKQPYNFG